MANKRVTATQRVKQDNLFASTTDMIQEQENKSNIVNNETKKHDYKRQTYFLSSDIIHAIALKSVYHKMDKSEIVREALKQYIEDRFFDIE